jgi:peptide/nickel transport system permease protein
MEFAQASDKKASLEEVKEAMKKDERRIILKRFSRNKLAVYGLMILLFLAVIAILAPVIKPAGPYFLDVSNRLAAPGNGHLLGTDTFGRDLLARILYGTRISLEIGASVSLLSLVFGLIIGLYASYYKFLDQILMRICDGISAIPAILLAIAFMAVLGSSTKNVILSLSMVYIPTVARIARSQALSIMELTYIESMRALGASSTRIIWRHIAPNILSPVIVQTSFVFAKAIITEAALSFLGVGVPVPTPSLGNILYEAKTVIYKAWWMVVYPGGVTALSILGLNMLGDGLRDALDQHSR